MIGMEQTNQRQTEKYQRMLTQPVEKLVCALAVPCIFSMLVTAFYNMADTYFVGKLGTSATAAVGVVFAIMALIQACGFFFGQGSGNNISRLLGAGETDEAEGLAACGFFSALIAGGVVAVLGNLFCVPIARLLGSSDTILPYAVAYMRIILCGAPFMMGSLTLNNLLRFQGNANFAIIGILTGAVANLILDPVLIFACHMGIAGAALATVLGQALGCVVLFVVTQRCDAISIHLRSFRPSGEQYFLIFKGGMPSLCRQAIGSIGTMAMNWAAGVYGDSAIAAMSVVNRITMMAVSAMIGFGQGFQPVCGFNYGAKRNDRVKMAFYFCVKVATVFLLVVAVAGVIFAPQLIAVFRKDDPAVIAFGTLALRLQLIAMPLAAWVVMGNMMLQTMGMTGRASFLSLARQGVFLIPILLILPYLVGPIGVQSAQMIADILSFAIAIPILVPVLRGMGRRKTE